MTTSFNTVLGFFAGSPGPLELVVIFLVVLVLFGPRRLPEIARTIGRALQEMRRASDEFKAQIMSIEADAHDADSSAESQMPCGDAGADAEPGDELTAGKERDDLAG